ncbi:deoxyribonuclease II (macronuclear) [Tetrahymena thermophila SB210]|uniref:Deoxyribonuclease II n=1 Tax=Tetrahymena thermophila (strain SB210) TaxID=312017 RepID=I7MB47_TETTS|nr:deoxyribonuclease II [Tetrahymena thermophila SB210]EAS07643.2 deoxyribonuclease II [Tetrahymena thermophila SB210]|eukprot:XP_001027885.2 deoxyribonuclease II [Tetrahymena thermophila SB210]
MFNSMTKEIRFLKKLLIVIISLSLTRGDLSCKGIYQQDVAFYVIQSMPYDVQVKEQIYFGYTDDQNLRSTFNYSPQNLLFNSSSPISLLISQINDDPSIKFIQWDNNQGKSSLSSFSKGLVAIQEESEHGLFFGYSMNNFLKINKSKIEMNLNQQDQMFGQQFFCISLDLENLEKLAENLLITKINVQFSNISSQLKFKNLSRLQNYLNIHYPLDYKTVDLNLINSEVIVKMITQNYWIYYNTNISSDFESLTIDDQISAILNCDILFKNSKPSVNQCQPHYTSETILTIQHKNYKLDSKQDKSKWILCKNNNQNTTPFICLSDLDNYTPRYFHGGNLFCFKSKQLHQLYSNMISSINFCTLDDILHSKPRDNKFTELQNENKEEKENPQNYYQDI